MNTNDIDAIRKLTDAAEGGPWRVVEEHGRDIADEAYTRLTIQTDDPSRSREIAELVDPDHSWSSQLPEGNAEFIAAARALVPALCDEIEQLRAKVEDRRVRLRDAENDLLDVRGILSPNGYPRRVPVDLVPTVAPAVRWLADRVDELHAENARARENVAELENLLDQTSAARDRFRRERDEYAEDNTRAADALIDVQRQLAAERARTQETHQ